MSLPPSLSLSCNKRLKIRAGLVSGTSPVVVRFPPSHVIYVKHREVASRYAPKVRSFVRFRSTFRYSCGLLVWDSNHAAFSAVGPTTVRGGPTFPPPFLTLPRCSTIPGHFRGLLVLLLSLSLSFFLEFRNRVPRKRI